MANALHAISAAHILLAAAVSLAASWALRRRVVSAEAVPAALALRAFWAGFGATAIVQGCMLLLALAGAATAAATIATTILAYGTSVFALGALAAYFAFVFTGSKRAVPAMVALYSTILAVGLFTLLRAGPVDLAPTRWTFEVIYARPPEGALAALPAIIALLPSIAGTIGFLLVGLRSSGVARQRALLVGTALLFWLVSIVVDDTGPTETDAVQVVRKVASVVGFGAIYLAYLAPPRWQRRWGLVAIGEEEEYPHRQAERERTQLEGKRALHSRVRELV